MSSYGWILAISGIVPALLSINKRGLKMLVASLIAAVPFLVWDEVFTKMGVWGFTAERVGKIKIGSMPIEEVMFFVIIPFCCLFLYCLVERFLKDKKIGIKMKWWWITLIMIGAGIISRGIYSQTVLVWSGLTVAILNKNKIWQSRNYWLWMAITMVPFVIVNGYLTGLPVVWYSDGAIAGIRIGTIPIEDFLYSWALLTLNLAVFRRLTKDRGDCSRF